MSELPPIADEKMEKHCVAVSEKGMLFIPMGRYFLQKGDKRPRGWYGLGFNGEQVMSQTPEFVAKTINEHLEKENDKLEGNGS